MNLTALTTLALTITLLTISNVFMTFAWYGHLKFKHTALWAAVLVSWLIAFLEYCFQVPANRIGSERFRFAQLKVMQEIITMVVFAVFMVLYLGERFRWNHAVAFGLMIAAAFFVFKDFDPPQEPSPTSRSQSVNSP